MVWDPFIAFRRRQTDWQTQTFRFIGLPPLAFADLHEASFSLVEVLKPQFDQIGKRTAKGVVQIDEKKGIALFKKALDGKVGVELENAAAELMLTSSRADEASDWERFNGWVARRSQPLDPRLIEALGRFYVCRLNKVLERTRQPAVRRAPTKAAYTL